MVNLDQRKVVTVCSCEFGCFPESAAACFKPFHPELLLRGAKSEICQIKDDIACMSFSVLEYPSISTFRAAFFAVGIYRGQRIRPLRYALKLGRRGAGVTGAKGRNIGVGECGGSAERSVSGSSVAWMEGRRKYWLAPYLHGHTRLPVCVDWSSWRLNSSE